MINDPLPQPEPSGALVPPPRYPPTAIALSTPPPPEPSVRSRQSALFRVINECLDVLDQLGDAVAHALRLR